MAYIKTKEGMKSTTNQKEFALDSYDDLATIPTSSFQIGDCAYIIGGDHKGELYISDNTKTWILQ